MPNKFYEIAFTDAMKDAQRRYSSRRRYEKVQNAGADNDRLTGAEIDFIERADGKMKN